MYIFYYIFINYLFCIYIFSEFVLHFFNFIRFSTLHRKRFCFSFCSMNFYFRHWIQYIFVFVFLIKIFVNYKFSTGCRFLKQNQLFEISSNAFHSHFNLHFLLEYFVYFVFNAFLVWVCFVCVLASASASHICCYPLCSRRRSRTDERCTQTQPQMSVCAPL